MRGAIIGFGTIAMGHMVGYSRIEDLSIAAVVDVSEERRRHARESFGLPVYEDVAGLVANESLDFIDLCTPPSSHAEYSASGIGHGLHVLCEKPVFLPGEDGYASQLRVIRASDRVFCPCHAYKYAPVLTAMQERIAAPAFGEVVGAHFRTLRAGHAKGRRPSGRLLRGRPPAVGPRGRSADRPGGRRVGGGWPRGTTRRRADTRLRARPRRRAARAGRCGVTAPQEPAAVAARRRESVPGAENQWRATEDDRTVAGDG